MFYRAARRTLDAEAQHAHADIVAREALARVAAHARVAAYFARDGEVDLQPLFEGCWQRHVLVAVPVLRDGEMRFAAHRPDQVLHLNRFGIAEPEKPEFVVPSIVFAPLVAFDGRGRRLGMGGGYYDRYFAAVPTEERVGIAHECQRAPELPAGPRDVALTAVVTEHGWQSF